MESFFTSLPPAFVWLLRTSGQGAALIILVLLVQWLFRKQLSPRWRFALWWLVLVRLMLPVSLESAVSIFNLAKVGFEWKTAPFPKVIVLQAATHRAPLPHPDLSPQPYIYPVNPPRLVDAQLPSTKQVTTLAAKPVSGLERFQLSIEPRLRTALLFLPALWLCGVTLLAGRVLLEQVRLTHRMRTCRAVNDPVVLDLLEECKRTIGVETPLTLIETNQVQSPALYGVLRPWLLLPEGLLQNFNRAELRHVFLHELAHVKRQDIAVNWLATVLQVLHWFNPLVWFAFNRMRADRELACDALALSCVQPEESRAYGQTIIKLLEGFARSSSLPGLIGILEDKNQMKRRIAMIAQFKKASRWSRLAILLLGVLGALTLTDAQTQKVALPQTDKASVKPSEPPLGSQPAKARLTLRVVDSETGQGLADAKIQANYFYIGSGMEGYNLRTDTNGAVAIPESKKATRDGSMNVFVTAERHVPKVAHWSEGNVPTEYTIKLDGALAVGGLVVNEQGSPVNGVKIHVHSPSLDDEWSLESIEFHRRDSAVTSDPDGRWLCTYIPNQYESTQFILTHEDYAVTQVTVPVSKADSTNATVIIKRGLRVTGRVKDQEGRPIAEAKVKELHNYGYRRQSTETADDGTFTLKGLGRAEVGDVALVVQANGFAPQIRTIQPSETKDAVEFTLSKGNAFRGRVVDEEGKPITNAVVQTDSDNQGLRKVEWETRTDRDGRFEWDSAPPEPILFWFEADGYNWNRSVLLAADGGDHVIKLTRKTKEQGGSFEVAGIVKDAETGQPLPRFRALVGEVGHPESPPDFRVGGAIGEKGYFRLTISTPCFFPAYVIQIQADGYLPAVSTNIAVKAGDQRLEFALKKGAGLSGVVVLPNGKPIQGATVFLCGLQGSVYMDKPAQVRKEASHLANVVTDQSGRFQFQPTVDAHTLIVVHEQGYAEVPVGYLEKTSTIPLSPYGRVEGTLLVDGKPATNETINVMMINYRYGDGARHFAPLSLWLAAKTDAAGRFIFEKVPPGERKIAHRLSFRDGKMGTTPLSHGFPFNVAAGETATVKIGGTGRPVIGRVLAPGFNGSIDWQNDVQKLSSELSDPPSLVRPKHEDYSSPEAFIEASRQFSERHKAYWISEEGRARERGAREFVPVFDSGGSFRISDVPPGSYKLQIKVTEPQGRSLAPSRVLGQGTEIGSLTTDVVVPEVVGGRSDEPLDLGVLALILRKSRPDRAAGAESGQELLKVGGAAQQARTAATESERNRVEAQELLKARDAAQGKAVLAEKHLKEAGSGTHSSEFEKARSVRDQQLTAAKRSTKKLAVYHKYAEETKRLERKVKVDVETGKLPIDVLDIARFERLQAEVDLARAEGRLPAPKPKEK